MVGAGGGSCLQSVDLHLTLLGRTNIFVYLQNFTWNVMGVEEVDGLGNDLDKIQFFLAVLINNQDQHPTSCTNAGQEMTRPALLSAQSIRSAPILAKSNSGQCPQTQNKLQKLHSSIYQ